MFNRMFYILVLYFLVTIQFVTAQECSIRLEGRINDQSSGKSLEFVQILIQETSQSAYSNERGEWFIQHICPGEYHLIISHIGCEIKEMHVHLFKDTLIQITLSHTAISLDGVTIDGGSRNHKTQAASVVGKEFIEENAQQNLSNLLSNEAGVSTLRNGTSISKPIVQGLFGNRLTILNNGVPLSGQQWGNDHSPEIDPLSATRITVLKGAGSIEYFGGNIGGVILVEPERIQREPHLHGRLSYLYEHNGRGSNLNAQLQKYSPIVAWKLNGTLKYYGDRSTPDYFLNNSGSREYHGSLQLEKTWKDRLFCDVYFSSFNTSIGVLRGSHVGNLTDLNEALKRSLPFFTEDKFSYDIDAPKQTVSHQFAKFQSKYHFAENQSLEWTLALQLNERKEFDVRRGGRESIPALSLRQWNTHSGFKYQGEIKDNWNVKTGLQLSFTDNTNDPATGILPLIPDYLSWKFGAFASTQLKFNKTDYQCGVRYDFEYQNVAAISRDLPRKIVRSNNKYGGFSVMNSLLYGLTQTQKIGFQMGFTLRNPAINELYSNGLHQAVAGIEEGNENLKSESALKLSLEHKWIPNSKISLQTLFYVQRFWDYIYLQAQDEFRLTIRGAFPVFQYKQTNAIISGLDLAGQWSLGSSWAGQLRLSLIKGNDISNQIPLINIPPASVYGNVTYRLNRSVNFRHVKYSEIEFELGHHIVFKKSGLLENQDYKPAPPAYQLTNFNASTDVIFSKYKCKLFFKIDNLFDIKYRDYLNFQRYFADDLGRSIIVGINFKF